MPINKLFDMYKTLIKGNAHSVEGIEDESLLLSRYMSTIEGRLPRELGMGLYGCMADDRYISVSV